MVVRDGCSFNRTRWHELVDMFPQFAPKLANGDESKLLVRWFKDESVPVEDRKPFDRHSFVRNQFFVNSLSFTLWLRKAQIVPDCWKNPY